MVAKNINLINLRGIAFIVEGLGKIGELKDDIYTLLK